MQRLNRYTSEHIVWCNRPEEADIPTILYPTNSAFPLLLPVIYVSMIWHSTNIQCTRFFPLFLFIPPSSVTPFWTCTAYSVQRNTCVLCRVIPSSITTAWSRIVFTNLWNKRDTSIISVWFSKQNFTSNRWSSELIKKKASFSETKKSIDEY